MVDRTCVTDGGVTAGIDFGLRLAELAVETAAKLIALGLEYDRAPPFRGGHPDREDPALVAEIHRRFEAQLEREGGHAAAPGAAPGC